MNSIEEYIIKITSIAIKKCGYHEIPIQLFKSKHSDCTTNVAFLIAKELKLNPKDVAKNIVDNINNTIKMENEFDKEYKEARDFVDEWLENPEKFGDTRSSSERKDAAAMIVRFNKIKNENQNINSGMVF